MWNHLIMAIKCFSGLPAIFLCLLFLLQGCAATKLDSNPVAIRAEAALAYKEGRFDEAVTKFEQLVAKVPKDSELWFRLGNSYAKAKNPDLAIVAYRNALLRDPEFGKAWYNLGVIQMQEALKAFIEMKKYVPADDPVSIAAEKKCEVLFRLLHGDAGKK